MNVMCVMVMDLLVLIVLVHQTEMLLKMRVVCVIVSKLEQIRVEMVGRVVLLLMVVSRAVVQVGGLGWSVKLRQL